MGNISVLGNGLIGQSTGCHTRHPDSIAPALLPTDPSRQWSPSALNTNVHAVMFDADAATELERRLAALPRLPCGRARR